MTTFRHLSANKAWARMEQRAETGEKFGLIACLLLLYRQGTLSRVQVRDLLNKNHVSREDLQKFKAQTAHATR